MYSHYEKSRIPFSYLLYAYSVKRAYRGTKLKRAFGYIMYRFYVLVMYKLYVQVMYQLNILVVCIY